MVKVVGIRFRNAGKIYYFGPGDLDLKAGMHAIVETARGVEIGTVITNPREVSEESVIQPLKPVLRIATEADERQAEKNAEDGRENDTTAPLAIEACSLVHFYDAEEYHQKYLEKNPTGYCHVPIAQMLWVKGIDPLTENLDEE